MSSNAGFCMAAHQNGGSTRYRPNFGVWAKAPPAMTSSKTARNLDFSLIQLSLAHSGSMIAKFRVQLPREPSFNDQFCPKWAVIRTQDHRICPAGQGAQIHLQLRCPFLPILLKDHFSHRIKYI